jgi:23S rRNA (uracil1939-C5)-methyltransferase
VDLDQDRLGVCHRGDDTVSPMGAIVVETAGAAAGGGAVGRLDDGRVVFVDGALPGERVSIELVVDKKRFARGTVVEVLDPAAGRVAAPCVALAAGCGGCDLQHATPELQRDMKAEVVHDALTRIGRVEAPEIARRDLPATGFRTTVRAAVDGNGRAAFRRHQSHDLVTPENCLVAHPKVEELLIGGRFHDASEVVVRVGDRTGDRLVIVTPSARRTRLPGSSADVVLAGSTKASEVSFHEEVADRRWRISGSSFFQSRPDGADALVEIVAGEVARLAGRPGVLVDLCAGVGLFAGTIPAERVVAVESNRGAAVDAAHNLKDIDAQVDIYRLEQWTAVQADVVVADPPREGLAATGVGKIVDTGADVVVLVSCDSGSLGRDAGLLAAEGYRLDSVTLVDMFPQTHHVEVVSAFTR